MENLSNMTDVNVQLDFDIVLNMNKLTTCNYFCLIHFQFSYLSYLFFNDFSKNTAEIKMFVAHRF